MKGSDEVLRQNAPTKCSDEVLWRSAPTKCSDEGLRRQRAPMKELRSKRQLMYSHSVYISTSTYFSWYYPIFPRKTTPMNLLLTSIRRTTFPLSGVAIGTVSMTIESLCLNGWSCCSSLQPRADFLRARWNRTGSLIGIDSKERETLRGAALGNLLVVPLYGKMNTNRQFWVQPSPLFQSES